MIPILYTFLAFVASVVVFQILKSVFAEASTNEFEANEIPNAFPRWPYFGNTFQVYRNPVKFIKDCRKSYGNFFRVKLCRTNFVVVCDRQVALQLSKADEKDLSLYEVLRGIYFERSCFDGMTHLAADALKKGIVFKKATVLPKLQKEAEKLIKFLKTLDLSSPISHKEQLDVFGKYVASVLFETFLGKPMNDSMYPIVLKFFALMKRAIKATHFVPMWLVHLVVRPTLMSLRHNIRSYVDQLICQHQANPNMESSTFLRAICDKVDNGTGEKMTTEQVGGHLLAFLFAGTQNSGTLIQQVLVDLAQNPTVYDELKSEVSPLITKNDMEGILNCPFLHAVIMEAARLYPTLFGLMRQCPADIKFAGYNFKRGDICSISNPMMMQDEAIFKNPLKYNPHRFMGENPEPCSSMMVTSWGSGVHLCPGKKFALYEIKMAVAYLVNSFGFQSSQKKIKVNYTSTGSFAERKVSLFLTPV